MAPTNPTKERTPPPLRTVTQGEVLSGAALISRSLKDVSRELRKPQPLWVGGSLGQQAERLKSSFGAKVLLAFIGGVLLPLAIAGLYLAIFASDQFASEARFAVRGNDRGPIDPMASISGASSGHRQDTLIISEYIHSRGMVEELEKTLNLREIFAKGDWLFSFNPERSIERLVRYWYWQTDVNVEQMSGIITVTVRAFTPEDSLAISRAVVAASEKLVNDLSDRSRRDALKQAQTELTLAEKALQDKIKAMRDLRESEGMLDATKTSDAMMKLIGDLRLEVAKMESEYSSNRQTVAENSPQMRVLAARIRSTREQIRLIEARMTDTRPVANAAGAPRDPALAESFSRFDRLRLEQEFAQKHYVDVAASFERARIEVEAQQVYLATFLQPVLAQEALYPKKGWIMAALAAICLVLWGAGTGIAVLVRNYGA